MQRTARVALLATIYGVLPNLLFAVAGAFLFLPRAWINVDYLALGAAALWLPWPCTAALFMLLALLDIVFALAPGYHFQPDTAFVALGDMLHWDALYGGLIAGGALAMLVALCALGAWATPRLDGATRLAAAAGLLLAAALAGGTDIIQEHRSVTASGHQRAETDIASSSVHRIGVIASRALEHPDRFFGDPETMRTGIASATQSLFERIDRGERLPRRIWLVMVESLGHFEDPALDQLQWSSLLTREMHARYDITRGSVPFRGSTVPGELRELCRVELSRYPRREGHVLPLGCLPERLRQLGYSTLAVHGFSGSMFSRSNWYQGLGFQETWFIHSLWNQVPARLCGLSFRGLCDADVGNLLRRRIPESHREPEFLYWLTLNGHLPHSGVPRGDTSLTCSHEALRDQPETVCDLVRLHDIVMRTLARMLADAAAYPPMLIVVGDHPPHVLSHDLRARVNETHVPFALLTPKADRT